MVRLSAFRDAKILEDLENGNFESLKKLLRSDDVIFPEMRRAIADRLTPSKATGRPELSWEQVIRKRRQADQLAAAYAFNLLSRWNQAKKNKRKFMKGGVLVKVRDEIIERSIKVADSTEWVKGRASFHQVDYLLHNRKKMFQPLLQSLDQRSANAAGRYLRLLTTTAPKTPDS
jgi:hypothetical protein